MVLRAASLSLLACCLLQAQSTAFSTNRSAADTATSVADSPPPALCPAGGPLGAIELRVRSPEGASPLPFRTINHLSEGDTVLYAPILRSREKRPGQVSLVLVPARRNRDGDRLIVTDPKPADKPQEWKITQTMSLAALVYGPGGLSKKKVSRFLTQDDLLIAQLADYAERTEQTESLLEALESTDSSSASVNAALSGFASQYGLAVSLDKSAPPAAQAETLFATMNPQLATYNPLTPSSASRVGQTASLATAAAGLFFGNPIGLAAGGTAMLLDLRAIAFPDTQFRSSFAQVLSEKNGLNLCGQRGPVAAHTRVAYIWASRIPNTPAPAIHIGAENFLPVGQKSPVPVEVPAQEWKYLERARDWTLDNGKTKTPVKVLKLGNQKALEIDLAKTKFAPGNYNLAGYWDWTPFEATGNIHVRPVGDLARAKLEPASQDRVLAKSGKIPVTLTGADFEFTTKAELKRAGDEFAEAEPIRFLLPEGLRAGPQDHMDVQIDTTSLEPGTYDLLLSQGDVEAESVALKVLAPAPTIENLPILANQGAAAQHYVLKGAHLGQLARLEASDATLVLGEATSDQTQRDLTVRLRSGIRPGSAFPISAYVQNRIEPVTLGDALQIIGPLPLVASSRISLPQGIAVALNPGEAPAGSFLTAVLDVKNIGPRSVLRLACADDLGPLMRLHIGEQTATHSLQQLSQDQLFLSLDTSGFPAGCSLQAIIDNDGRGRSQPFTLAQMIRLPRIETFEVATAQDADGTRTYTLTGYNLEMIGKAGWDAADGTDIADLPAPVPGEGLKQILRISLPDPAKSQAPLFIWLRGETNGRATTILCPALPAGARPAAAPVLPKSLPMPDTLPPVVPAPMPAPPKVAVPGADFPLPDVAGQVAPPGG
jgi:hypothetical protein